MNVLIVRTRALPAPILIENEISREEMFVVNNVLLGFAMLSCDDCHGMIVTRRFH